MTKIELPHQESAQPSEVASDPTTPGRPETVPGPQRPRLEKGPAKSAIAGVLYRRTFACASSAQEPDEEKPVKT